MRTGLILTIILVQGITAVHVSAQNRTRWSFDFEDGIPPEVQLMGATLDNRKEEKRVITGNASILANFAESATQWNEFLHTRPSVVFEKGKTYHVSLAYRALAVATAETQFYCKLRSRSGQGDIDTAHWLWFPDHAELNVAHRLFVVDKDDCYLIVGIRNRGIMEMDDLTIEQVEPKFVPPNFKIKPGPDKLAPLRKELDELRSKQALVSLLDDMLIIACNERSEKAAAATRTAELMSQFQIDFVDWNSLAPMGRKFGVRTSTGGPEYQEFYASENRSVYADRNRLFTGSGFAVPLENTRISYPDWGGAVFMCHNGDNWHEHYKKLTWEKVSQMMGVCQDNISAAPWLKGGGCFCTDCSAKFRDHLRERYTDEELRILGITSLPSFSVHQHILSQGLIGNEHLSNPVIFEYIKFQNISQTLNWARCVKHFKDQALARNRSMPVYGNQLGIGSWYPFAVLLSPFNDIVQIEEVLGIGDQAKNSSIDYKMAHASGNHERPVWMRGPVADDKKPGYPQLSTSFWTLHLAEALAAGGVRDFSFGYNQPPGSKKMDYVDDRNLMLHWADFARFMRNNRPLFSRRESAAPVALVYSVPGAVFRKFPPLNIDSDRTERHRKWAEQLDQWHVPYEVVIFGHPELFDDTKSLARLDRYKAVLLPNADALSQAQIRALKRYQSKGGLLLSAEAPGTLDENYNKRPAAEGPGLGDGVLLPEGSLASAKDKLAALSGVAGDLPETVQINLWRSQDGRALDVHLLNYDINVAEQTANRIAPCVITVDVPADVNFNKALLIRPFEAIEEIPFENKEGRVTLHLPGFDIYAIISLTTSERLEREQRMANERREQDRIVVKQQAAELNYY